MKRQSLERILAKKFKLKVTRRKRSKNGFLVTLPTADGPKWFLTKRAAMVWLHVQLRLEPVRQWGIEPANGQFLLPYTTGGK